MMGFLLGKVLRRACGFFVSPACGKRITRLLAVHKYALIRAIITHG